MPIRRCDDTFADRFADVQTEQTIAWHENIPSIAIAWRATHPRAREYTHTHTHTRMDLSMMQKAWLKLTRAILFALAS